MMLAAPPRAKTGALEPVIMVAIAATARDNFRDVFMPSILVGPRPVMGFAAKPPVQAGPVRQAAGPALPKPT